MSNFNKVILMGRLTRDPELRYTPSGLAVSSFGLAVNSRTRQGEEWKDEVCFIDIVLFGKQAENCSEYLSKGKLVLVEGRLRWRSWESEGGQKKSKHEVLASTVRFMPKGAEPGAGGGFPSEADEPPLEDDLPF